MRIFEIINSNRISTLDLLKKYVNDDNWYVSFTSIPKLGINPNTHYYDTPVGIYAYPIKEYVNDLVKTDDLLKIFRYIHNNEYAAIFYIDPKDITWVDKKFMRETQTSTFKWTKKLRQMGIKAIRDQQPFSIFETIKYQAAIFDIRIIKHLTINPIRMPSMNQPLIDEFKKLIGEATPTNLELDKLKSFNDIYMKIKENRSIMNLIEFIKKNNIRLIDKIKQPRIQFEILFMNPNWLQYVQKPNKELIRLIMPVFDSESFELQYLSKVIDASKDKSLDNDALRWHGKDYLRATTKNHLKEPKDIGNNPYHDIKGYLNNLESYSDQRK